MKLENIDYNKIKVTFTPEDLVEHNITPEAVRDNAPWVQRLLMDVVKKAECEMDFYANGARLMVEAMPGEGDSMVMYITKLDSDEALKDVINSVKRRIRLKVKPAEEAEKTALISFASFDDAVKLARFSPVSEGGELYFYENRYHLVISANQSSHFSEFGIQNHTSGSAALVAEHGKLISKNALAMLKEYF